MIDVEMCADCGKPIESPDDEHTIRFGGEEKIVCEKCYLDQYYDGPGDAYYEAQAGGSSESPSYREEMRDAGREHLLP